MSYRRKWGTQVWHSSPGCPNWPESELQAEERHEAPTHGELCYECQRRELAAMTARAPRVRVLDA